MIADRLAYLKEYQKRRRAERKQYCIEKLGGKCAACGSVNDLQFDHIKAYNVDRPYKSCISELLTFKQSRLDEELEKCQLLCRDCHVYKSNNVDRVHASQTHGTLSSYRYCKCDVCVKAKRDYQRDYMRRARTSVVEGGPHKSNVVGSIPTAPTNTAE